MYLRPAFLVIAATASVMLGATALQADETGTPPRPGREYCKENPGKNGGKPDRTAEKAGDCQPPCQQHYGGKQAEIQHSKNVSEDRWP